MPPLSAPLLDVCGRRRSPVTYPEYRAGRKPPNAGKTYPAEVLTRDEVGRLIDACSRRGPSGLRNRALIVVMWRAGLRVSEALELAPKDVDLAGRPASVTVLHGKRDKRRTVGIHPDAAAVIERWLACRRGLGIGPRSPLFCSIAEPVRGGPIRSAYVRTLFHRLGERAGIDKRVHPHGLRHTMAFELMKEGVPLVIIQKQLGHTELATTARYVDHLCPSDLLDAMAARV